MPTKSLAAETPVQVKVLPLYKKDYMKSSYRDFKLKLVGPLDVTIEDYHVPQHFTNLTNFRAQRVSSPYEQGSLTEPNYYRSTIAKTGFKLKF